MSSTAVVAKEEAPAPDFDEERKGLLVKLRARINPLKKNDRIQEKNLELIERIENEPRVV